MSSLNVVKLIAKHEKFIKKNKRIQKKKCFPPAKVVQLQVLIEPYDDEPYYYILPTNLNESDCDEWIDRQYDLKEFLDDDV